MIYTLRRLMCDKFSVLCTLAELNAKQLREFDEQYDLSGEGWDDNKTEVDTMRVNTKIKLLHPDAVVPKYAHEDDVCFDLVAVEDVIIEPGQTKKIPTGISLQPPPDYWIDIRPRSGISEKTKLRISNSPGTIDAYTGEIGVLFDNIAQKEIYGVDLNERDVTYWTSHCPDLISGESENNDWSLHGNYPQGTYIIRKGDRVAQALVTLKYKAKFTVVDELAPTERGDKGFGSSGVK